MLQSEPHNPAVLEKSGTVKGDPLISEGQLMSDLDVAAGVKIGGIDLANLAPVVVDDTEGGTSGLTTKGISSDKFYNYTHNGSLANAIINGSCAVRQRAAATLVKDTYVFGLVDRFAGMATGTSVDAGTLGYMAASSMGTARNWLRFVTVTITGTGILYLRHRIEAKDAMRFYNQYASFSCNVYHAVGSAINYTVYIRKPSSADDTFSSVTEIANSGAISVPNATVTAIKFENVSMGDCRYGIEIEIKIECGAISSKTFYLNDFQLVLGSNVMGFMQRPFQQEYALCQRYYEKSMPLATTAYTGTAGLAGGVSRSADQLDRWPVFFSVPKRTTPTVTLYAYSSGTAGKIRNTTDSSDLDATATAIGETGFLIAPSANTTANKNYAAHWTADAEL